MGHIRVQGVKLTHLKLNLKKLVVNINHYLVKMSNRKQ